MLKLKTITFLMLLYIPFADCEIASLKHGLTASAGRQDIAAWERYTASEEEFSVLLPELPAVTESVTPLGSNGKVKRREHTYAAYSDGVVYLIVSYENPKLRQSLDEIIKEQLFENRSKPQIVSQREVANGGFSGKQYVFKEPWHSYEIVARFFITEKHLYQIKATGGNEENPAVKKFMESFSLVRDKPKGKDIGAGARTGESTETIATASSSGSSKEIKPPDVFSNKDGIRKAVIVSKPSPRYTEQARRQQTMGTALLKMIFSSSGRVENIIVESGLPYGLTEEAIKAARKIYFIPALKDGKRVSQYIKVEYNFNLY